MVKAEGEGAAANADTNGDDERVPAAAPSSTDKQHSRLGGSIAKHTEYLWSAITTICSGPEAQMFGGHTQLRGPLKGLWMCSFQGLYFSSRTPVGAVLRKFIVPKTSQIPIKTADLAFHVCSLLPQSLGFSFLCCCTKVEKTWRNQSWTDRVCFVANDLQKLLFISVFEIWRWTWWWQMT